MFGRIKRIADKIDRLRALDQDFSVFGSVHHRYELNPPVASELLAAVEAQIGVPLPADYREFITSIGDGGAGPSYGLMRLTENEGQLSYLDADFPYTADSPLRLANDLHLKELSDQIDRACEGADRGAETAAWEAFNQYVDVFYREVTKGITFLADKGCLSFEVLVLRGQEAGHVWSFDVSDELGAFPLTDHSGKPLTFADWYENWLDTSLADPRAAGRTLDPTPDAPRYGEEHGH
jgi:hypothetical protein